MKKLSKCVLAIAMAAIMAMPALLIAPFSASAISVSDATPGKHGLVRTGNSSRGNGDNGCITNDGGDDNMSAILWEFDLSGISSGSIVNSATLSEDIWSINNRNIPNQYLDFWYCNPADMSNSDYLNNSNYRDSSLGYGTTGPSSYKTAFGITESTPLYSVQHVFESDGATLSFSNDALVDALNKALDENWGAIVFVLMFNEPAATQWSDIWAGLPKLSYETTELSDKEYVQLKMETYSGSNLTATQGDIHFSSDGSIPQTTIDNAVDTISDAQNLLEEAADFSALRYAFGRANALLLGLDSKAAQYDSSSIQTLINAVSNEDVVAYLSANGASAYGASDQAAADALADEINSAFNALTSNIGENDVSAYAVAVDTLNNLDKDAYDTTDPEGRLASAGRVASRLIKSETINYTNPLDSESTSKIKALTDNATQENVDDAVRTILNALYVNVKVYTIVTEGAVSEVGFRNGKTDGETSPYTATYGSTLVARSENQETAWYMEFDSDSTHRSKQFQDFGKTFTSQVFANTTIYAETRTSQKPNMIRIYRNYSNNSEKTPLEAVAFVSDSYELPEAKAYSCYNFAGYEVDGVIKQAGEVIEVAGDMDIKALYTFNGEADYIVNAIPLENGKGFNDAVAYNTKIELKGGENAYAWLEEIQAGRFRTFAIGSDISFLATESINLYAVTEEQFASYASDIPAINMRKSGVIVSGTKVTFTGQLVENNAAVKEYGVVIGVAREGGSVSEEDVDIINAGSHEGYDIIRAKSTNLVGANQFAIGINGLAGKDFIYKGYVVYDIGGREFLTVYTDIM